jgi:hypothetical protein
MDRVLTAEARAESLVGIEREMPNGAFNIVLRSPGAAPVHLGPYANRDVAKVEAALVRGFVAAVIREVRGAGEGLADLVAGDAIALKPPGTMVPSSPTSAVISSQIGSV